MSQTIGFLVGMLLLTYGFKKNKGNQLLGISYLFLTTATLLGALISSGLMVNFPNLYRTGNFFAFLYVPSIYLYIKTIVKEESFSKMDFIHLIPALLYLIDYMPIFLLSTDEKLSLILGEINNTAEYISFNQSQFFFPKFWVAFRTFLVLVYWVLSVKLLSKYQSKIGDIKRFFGKEWVSWMKIYLGFQLGLILPFISWAISLDTIYFFDIIHIPVALLIIVSGGAILFYPKVLYGMNEFEYLLDTQLEKEADEEEDQPILTEEKIIEIQESLIRLESTKKFYQEKGYAIRDLAKDTGIPSYILTIYINRILDTNFSDFVNEKRIEQCARLMEQGNFTHFTLEGLADTCGFNNRNSFLSAFKKFKGMTPSAFKKGLKDGDLIE
jgi:AraC-like DNA-binding protein